MVYTGATGVVSEHPGKSTDHADLADHRRQCEAVLGEDLTAYVAGADSVAQFEGWLSGLDESARHRAVVRLNAAVEVIRIFAARNLVSSVRHWLREVGPVGQPAPARRLRAAGDDDHLVKNVLAAATHWVADRRPARLVPA